MVLTDATDQTRNRGIHSSPDSLDHLISAQSEPPQSIVSSVLTVLSYSDCLLDHPILGFNIRFYYIVWYKLPFASSI